MCFCVQNTPTFGHVIDHRDCLLTRLYYGVRSDSKVISNIAMFYACKRNMFACSTSHVLFNMSLIRCRLPGATKEIAELTFTWGKRIKDLLQDNLVMLMCTEVDTLVSFYQNWWGVMSRYKSNVHLQLGHRFTLHPGVFSKYPAGLCSWLFRFCKFTN